MSEIKMITPTKHDITNPNLAKIQLTQKKLASLEFGLLNSNTNPNIFSTISSISNTNHHHHHHHHHQQQQQQQQHHHQHHSSQENQLAYLTPEHQQEQHRFIDATKSLIHLKQHLSNSNGSVRNNNVNVNNYYNNNNSNSNILIEQSNKNGFSSNVHFNHSQNSHDSSNTSTLFNTSQQLNNLKHNNNNNNSNNNNSNSKSSNSIMNSSNSSSNTSVNEFNNNNNNNNSTNYNNQFNNNNNNKNYCNMNLFPNMDLIEAQLQKTSQNQQNYPSVTRTTKLFQPTPIFPHGNHQYYQHQHHQQPLSSSLSQSVVQKSASLPQTQNMQQHHNRIHQHHNLNQTQQLSCNKQQQPQWQNSSNGQHVHHLYKQQSQNSLQSPKLVRTSGNQMQLAANNLQHQQQQLSNFIANFNNANHSHSTTATSTALTINPVNKHSKLSDNICNNYNDNHMNHSTFNNNMSEDYLNKKHFNQNNNELYEDSCCDLDCDHVSCDSCYRTNTSRHNSITTTINGDTKIFNGRKFSNHDINDDNSNISNIQNGHNKLKGHYSDNDSVVNDNDDKCQDDEFDDDGDDDDDDDDNYDDDDSNNPNLIRSNDSLLSPTDNLSDSLQKQNRKRPKGSGLYCFVCGATANGYNFDAITCESCKAFFRRNAYRDLSTFRCINNDKCVININTRKKCKKCRIKKCFSVGMRRDWIMTDHEREEKRRKIEENRRKKACKLIQQQNPNVLLFDSNLLHDLENSTYNQDKTQSSLESNNSKDATPPNMNISRPRRRRRRRRGLNYYSNKRISQMDTTNTSINNNNNDNDNDKSFSRSSSITQKTIPTPRSSTFNESNLKYHPVNVLHEPLEIDNNSKFNHNHNHNSHYDGDNPSSLKPIANFENNSVNKFPNVVKTESIENVSDYSNSNSNDNSDNCDDRKGDVNDTNNDNNENMPSIQNSEQFPDDNSDYSSSEYEEENDELTTEDKKFLNKINETYDIAVSKISTDPSSTITCTKDINTIINITELAVRRLIYYFKMNEDYHRLDRTVKVNLLKGRMMELLLIHGVIAFDKGSNRFHEPKTNNESFDANSLKAAYGEEIYNRIIRITSSLLELCEEKFEIIRILLFIVLFSPDNPNLTNEERLIVVKKQERYIKILVKFMASLFDNKDVVSKFCRFGDIYYHIIVLADDFRKIVLQFSDPNNVHDLMKEVFSVPSNRQPTPPMQNQEEDQQQQQQRPQRYPLRERDQNSINSIPNDAIEIETNNNNNNNN